MSGRCGVVVFAGALLLSTSTSAYVRTTSDKSGVPVEWQERCIIVRPDQRGSQDIPLGDVEGALDRSVVNWSARTLSCGNLLLQSGTSLRRADVGIDGQPTIVFRDDVWQRPGSLMPHDPSIIALTTVFYVDTPGFVGDANILDADVELNGVNYTFSTNVTKTQPRPGTNGVQDLENTLTHELGHVQGLGHTCWDHVRPTPPLDDQGQPIPDCQPPEALPQSILSTTMYPYPLAANETSKRHLSPDDVKGVCDVYPNTAPAPACYPEIDGGCSFGGAPAVPFPFAFPFAFAFALAWRRRRR